MERGLWLSLIGTVIAIAALLWNIHSTGGQLATSRNALQLSQQAWLAPVLNVEWNEDESKLSVSVSWKNIGHGPAMNIRTDTQFPVDVNKNPLVGKWDEWRGLNSSTFHVGILGPADAFVGAHEEYFGADAKARQDDLTVEGRAQYADVLGVVHEIQFCSHYLTDYKSFVSCPDGKPPSSPLSIRIENAGADAAAGQ